MIHFDTVNFSEHRNEEVMFLLMLSVVRLVMLDTQLLNCFKHEYSY